MLPATTVESPAERHNALVSAVTVVLPFEPVIARVLWPGGSARAKSSMSPTISAPRATAAAMPGESTDTPGLIAMRSAPANVASVNSPVTRGICGNSVVRRGANGGVARVSTTRTDAPWRTR